VMAAEWELTPDELQEVNDIIGAPRRPLPTSWDWTDGELDRV
jgi:hypothetical protein